MCAEGRVGDTVGACAEGRVGDTVGVCAEGRVGDMVGAHVTGDFLPDRTQSLAVLLLGEEWFPPVDDWFQLFLF